jgi:hypothetical protein
MPHVNHVLDSVIKTLEALSPEMRRQLADRLSESAFVNLKAAAAETEERTRITKIAAARDSRDPDFLSAQGILSRAAIKIEDCTDARAFDKLCASSHRAPSPEERMVVKSALFRLGVMAD